MHLPTLSSSLLVSLSLLSSSPLASSSPPPNLNHNSLKARSNNDDNTPHQHAAHLYDQFTPRHAGPGSDSSIREVGSKKRHQSPSGMAKHTRRSKMKKRHFMDPHPPPVVARSPAPPSQHDSSSSSSKKPLNGSSPYLVADPSLLPSSPPDKPYFTHIVIGGGQSGVVVASRLFQASLESEDRENGKDAGEELNVKVLVVEAGGSGEDELDLLAGLGIEPVEITAADSPKDKDKDKGKGKDKDKGNGKGSHGEDDDEGWTGQDQGGIGDGGEEQVQRQGLGVEERVQVPAMAWFAGIAYPESPYDWNYHTLPQPGLNNKSIYWPRGKILGGSSAVNGLYLVRSSKIEHDAWEGLWDEENGGMEGGKVGSGGKDGWGWDGVWEWMKKSENYTPPVTHNTDRAGVIYDWADHGQDGPIHYSYPSYFFEQIGNWTKTFDGLGVETRDPAGGEAWGSFIATSAIDPTTHRRSYAKNGYLDPILKELDHNALNHGGVPSITKKNKETRQYVTSDHPEGDLGIQSGKGSELWVLVGHQVTSIDFTNPTASSPTDSSHSPVATGVTFKRSNSTGLHVEGEEEFKVGVRSNEGGEVVLSSGVIGSPTLLQLSGVGPQDLLEELNIKPVHVLPGVGMHLQDHLSSQIAYSTSAAHTGDEIKASESFAMDQLDKWRKGEDSMYEAPNDAIAYIDLKTLVGEQAAADFVSTLSANLSTSADSYHPLKNLHPTVRKGYEATYKSEADLIVPSNVGQIELLMSNTGRGRGGRNSISLQVALQHPFSRGYVRVNTTNPFSTPVIDVGYLSHPADVQVLREGFKYARKVGQSPPLSNILLRELSPGSAVETDEEWEAFVRRTVSTEFHPAGSCSMLPLDMGGVVGKDMKVHGFSNLRVIDSSVVPVGLSAHLMAPTYGIAEKGAHIILSSMKPFTSTSSSSSSSSVAVTPPPSGVGSEEIDHPQGGNKPEDGKETISDSADDYDPIDEARKQGAMRRLGDLMVQVADVVGAFWFGIAG